MWYAQRHDIDYIEVFAPLARLFTIRLILANAPQFRQKVFQLDVKNVFLHEELKEDIFVLQLEGFIKKRKKKRYID